jgi:formylglycine-generating enzyme required for sulfatase activity
VACRHAPHCRRHVPHGSDRHYPEEAPVHRVALEGFLIDRTPVTNRQFKNFVRATGHVTFAEIPPAANNYPGALLHMLYAGSLMFSPPAGAVAEANLLYTSAGKSCFPRFRFYGPEKALFDKSWTMPDIAQVK